MLGHMCPMLRSTSSARSRHVLMFPYMATLFPIDVELNIVCAFSRMKDLLKVNADEGIRGWTTVQGDPGTMCLQCG